MIVNLVLLRKQIRRPLGTGGPDGSFIDEDPDDLVDEWANYSYRELLHRYMFREKELVGRLTLTAGRRDYPMPNPHDGLRQIDIVHPTSLQHTTLIAMSMTDYTSKWNETESARGYPTHYIRENCKYFLYPTPDDDYVITLRYWGILADLGTDNMSIEVPDIWWEPIKLGAIARGFMDHGDYQRANINQKLQAGMLSNMTTIQTKEEEDYHTAGLEVLGRDYEQ
jgi:hypothetical protein